MMASWWRFTYQIGAQLRPRFRLMPAFWNCTKTNCMELAIVNAALFTARIHSVHVADFGAQRSTMPLQSCIKELPSEWNATVREGVFTNWSDRTAVDTDANELPVTFSLPVVVFRYPTDVACAGRSEKEAWGTEVYKGVLAAANGGRIVVRYSGTLTGVQRTFERRFTRIAMTTTPILDEHGNEEE